MQLFCIGIIGEYVGRTFEQSKNRPVYIEKAVWTYETKPTLGTVVRNGINYAKAQKRAIQEALKDES